MHLKWTVFTCDLYKVLPQNHMNFYLTVIERFFVPPDSEVIYRDATGTEADVEIVRALLDKAMLCWLSEVSVSLKGRFNQSVGEDILQEYETTEMLTDATRGQMVNILVAHMIVSGYICGYMCFRVSFYLCQFSAWPWHTFWWLI